MKKNFIIRKAISITIVILALIFLSPQNMLYLFIFAGQAHFLASYFYQYRVGKINKSYLSLYLIGIVLLWALFIYQRRFDLLILFAGVIFLFHFLQDEIFISEKKYSIFTSLEIIPIIIIFSGFVIDIVLGTKMILYFFLLSLSFFIFYFLFAYVKRYKLNYLSSYFILGTLLLYFLYFLEVSIPLEFLLGSIIILHYSDWYIHYYFKVKDDKKERSLYLKSMFIINFAVLALFLVYFFSNSNNVLFYFFSVYYFYLWTLMHIFSNVRLDAYRNSIKF